MNMAAGLSLLLLACVLSRDADVGAGPVVLARGSMDANNAAP